ncbi:hypothetical protein OIE66_23625 [Nonomuraea sp. NBC_01738]|uniref:hypothetical protein n=1 Tax=Nonomuraea sp. NBC_01738 TaxID=2976003 RepID=UPI002E119DB3|nr:hypothetical protein OIE66_23625 [Nonomuraea sp. NBC_01738]
MNLDQMILESERALRRLTEATAALERLTATAESPSATATVDHTGRLLTLALAPRALRLDSATLAEEIARTIRAAQSDAASAADALLKDVLGEPASTGLTTLLADLDAAADAFTQARRTGQEAPPYGA